MPKFKMNLPMYEHLNSEKILRMIVILLAMLKGNPGVTREVTSQDLKNISVMKLKPFHSGP